VVEKKPAIYLIVILPILLVGTVSIITALLAVYTRTANIRPSTIPNTNAMLIALPTIFLWIPVTLLLSNCVLFAVPPLRRVAEAYVSRTNRPGFIESQRQLAKVVLISAVFCIPLIVLGFIL
jgi:hypothetical protein